MWRRVSFRQVTRASEPWEFSDGAVYLVRELCSVDPAKGVVFFEELADIARLTQFVQADCLRETIWKQVQRTSRRRSVNLPVSYTHLTLPTNREV